MTDPELQAAMQMLSVCQTPTYFTDANLWCFLACRMVKVSIEHGICGASAHGYAYLGTILGPVFHRYSEGYRFAKLGCDLVEKHSFIAHQGKAYNSMGLAAPWTQPITTAIDFNRAAFRTATGTGDLTSACYSAPDTSPSYSYGTIRSTRRGASRKWRWTSSAKQDSVTSRTLHRDYAGADRELLHFQRCAVRRGRVRSPTDD